MTKTFTAKDALKALSHEMRNVRATKPTKNIKLKTDKTGKLKVEPKPPRRSKSQQIAVRKSPKQKVVRRTAK